MAGYRQMQGKKDAALQVFPELEEGGGLALRASLASCPCSWDWPERAAYYWSPHNHPPVDLRSPAPPRSLLFSTACLALACPSEFPEH